MVAIERIHGQPVIGAAFSTPEKIVDLVPGDEKTPLGVVPFGGGKVQRFPLQIKKLLQQFLRTVEMEPHNVRVLLVGCGKRFIFREDGL